MFSFNSIGNYKRRLLPLKKLIVLVEGKREGKKEGRGLREMRGRGYKITRSLETPIIHRENRERKSEGKQERGKSTS